MNSFEPRTYRRRTAPEGMVAFGVAVGQTDLHVQIPVPQDADGEGAVQRHRATAKRAIRQARESIRNEIALRPEFAESLHPLSSRRGAPEIVSAMYAAGRAADVGPMAAVAGAIAQFVGNELLQTIAEVLVENGGDVFARTARERTIAIYAGRSPFSQRIGLALPAGETLGVCTSSGTFGHSHSDGGADAAVIAADDAAFADAAATALGNRVSEATDIEAALQWASEKPAVRAAMVICSESMGVWGEFEVVNIKQ